MRRGPRLPSPTRGRGAEEGGTSCVVAGTTGWGGLGGLLLDQQVVVLAGGEADRLQQRELLLEDHLLGDLAASDVGARGDLVHHIQQHVLHDGAQAAGAGLMLEGLACGGADGLLGEDQLHLVQVEELLELLDDGVLRLGHDLDQRVLVQRLQHHRDGEAADELRDQAVGQQILGDHLALGVADLVDHLAGLEAVAAPLIDAVVDDLLQALEGAAADEQDVGGVDLYEVLVGMLAATLGGHVGDGALDDLEQRLLHALAGDIAGDRGVVRLAGDLIDLVDVDDALLGTGDVEIGGLDQPEQDVLHILADVAGLGEGGGVGDAERHIQDTGQRLGQQRLAAAGGADQQDVALAQLHLVDLHPRGHALIVVVDRHREDPLGAGLPDHVRIELLEDPLGRRDLGDRELLLRGVRLFFLDDLAAQVDTLVADVDPARPGDQPVDLLLALPAERAAILDAGRLGVGHGDQTSGMAGTLEERISSMIPYSLASWAVMKKSRWVSFSTLS